MILNLTGWVRNGKAGCGRMKEKKFDDRLKERATDQLELGDARDERTAEKGVLI